VLSRRVGVEAAWKQRQADGNPEEGVVKGVVKNTEYGAFVDLGGIDGLLHITDMAWRRVRHRAKW
jgi:small subunit ribosomal protein S1